VSRSKQTEAQIIAALQHVEADRTMEDGAGVRRPMHTVYAWKAKYGGMSVSEAQAFTTLFNAPADQPRNASSSRSGCGRCSHALSFGTWARIVKFFCEKT
jgi:hypothetical protein